MTTSAPVVTSGAPLGPVPEESLPEFLLATARSGHPALIDGPSGRTTTYGELAAGIRRCAAGLSARGLRPGDVVAIIAPNVSEWLVVAYGAMAAGGTVSGVNPLYTAAEMATQLAGSDARFVVTVPPFLSTVRAALAQAGRRAPIVLLDGAAEGCTTLADLLATSSGPSPVTIDPATDLALLPSSSGTTGLPKAVMLTHGACVANVLQQQEAFNLSADDRVLAVAPFFHAVGFSVVANAALHAGATVVTMPRFDIEQFVALIERYRITTTIVVPPIVLALAKHPAVDRYDLSSLHWLGCGAAPLGAELQRACIDRLGRPVLQGWGMTEVVAGAALWPLHRPVEPGAAGKLLPGVEARVVDLADGTDRPPGASGELWIRSAAQMTGYRGNPAATAATVDADGWLHTGDVATVSADGVVHIVDRLKELIKVKGLQVAPAELEALLRAHPAVAEAAVVPVPDERCGEVPKAFVVRGAGPAVTAEELLTYVAARVAPHKRVRAVEFIDVVPTSPSGKTLRRLLRAAG